MANSLSSKLAVVAKPPRRKFGALKGQFTVPDDSFFFDPLPDDELKLWYGEDEAPSR